VLVVGTGDIAQTRAVKLGELEDGSWSVLEGIAPGDRVIVDGLQKVRPGQPVRVGGDGRPAELRAAATAAAQER